MNNRAIHIWGAVITLLLAANCYLTYRSALIYQDKPPSLRTTAEANECLAAKVGAPISLRGCPQGWYLKGAE
jgi:hypothetical protein